MAKLTPTPSFLFVDQIDDLILPITAEKSPAQPTYQTSCNPVTSSRLGENSPLPLPQHLQLPYLGLV